MKRNKQIKQRVNIPVLMATKTMKDYLASIPTEEADQLKAAATIKAKAEQGETFIIYKRTDYWYFVPLEYKTIAHESEV